MKLKIKIYLNTYTFNFYYLKNNKNLKQQISKN